MTSCSVSGYQSLIAFQPVRPQRCGIRSAPLPFAAFSDAAAAAAFPCELHNDPAAVTGRSRSPI
jgi:hypothetical protein